MAPELHSRQPLEMFPVLPRPPQLHTPSPPIQQHTTSMPCTPLHSPHLLTDRTSTWLAHLPKLHLRWRAHPHTTEKLCSAGAGGAGVKNAGQEEVRVMWQCRDMN